MENTYMPLYHLFPQTPQILHQLVVELFVRLPQFSPSDECFWSVIPSGPIYKSGPMLAEQWKRIAQSHPYYEKLILITGYEYDEDVVCITTEQTQFHTFFGTIQIDQDILGKQVSKNTLLFEKGAEPLEAQLPFIRGYVTLDRVVSYIVNLSLEQEKITSIVDNIIDFHGEKCCIVFVLPKVGTEKIMQYIKG